MNDAVEIPPDQGRSWWLREALAAEVGDPAPPLAEDTSADVVILGGGYTGLWTAWFITELDPGADVVLLEQDICGGGPSGRNGGFVNSFWGDLPDLCRRFGDRAALELCRAGAESVDAIGAFCADHGIDAGFRADGDLAVATSDVQIGSWADLVITADRLRVGEQIEVLGASETRARADSPLFRGGVLTRHSATVQPAMLARGIRRAVLGLARRRHDEPRLAEPGVDALLLAPGADRAHAVGRGLAGRQRALVPEALAQ